ncbi:hypothetical protein EV363DRAFT_1398652 [Boletus edulis]|nr:hypothetical protein EV363DRAFT_1398652 [Boletus edulis]
MAENVDLEELVHLEQTFYDAGYTDGYAHGRIHGLIEGRALGREKGFEIWEEIGFYEGFARTCQAIQAHHDVQRGCQRQDQRAMHHITHLLDLVRQFPTVNPSSSPSPSSSHSCHGALSSPSENETGTQPESKTETEVDLSTLQRQIRSRYKALCASIGVRPTLRPSVSTGSEDGDASGVSGTGDPQKRQVWTLEGDVRRSTIQGLSF